MSTLRRFVRRLGRLLGRRRVEAEMAEEMRYHLERRAADYAEEGLRDDAARTAALRRFGNIASIQEGAREAHRWIGFESGLKDVRFAVRHWARSPGFTTIAVLTLALGIGATTAIFSIVNSMVLRPLPYPNAGDLRQLWSRNDTIGAYPVATGASFQQWRDHATTVDVAGINDRVRLNLIEEDRTESVTGAAVSINYLDVLGVQPWSGRAFRAGEDGPDPSSQVVVLTYEWWQHRFGGDQSVLGRTLNLHARAYTVVGILSPRALAQDQVDFLIPMVLEEEGGWRMRVPWMTNVVRLRPGFTERAAIQELEMLTRELEARETPSIPTAGHQLEPLQQVLVGPSPPPYGLLSGAVAVVLLIVSVNLAMLLLARGTARQKEMAVRSAVGASTGRIVRQLLLEGLVLACVGGALGVAAAYLGLDLLAHLAAGDVPAAVRPEIDGRVLVFTLLVTVGTSLLFGLLPALQARRVDVQRGLKDESYGSTSAARAPALSALIIVEIAMTVMLLVGAGLLARSFARLLQVNPGFDFRQALTCEVGLSPTPALPDGAAVTRFRRELVEALEGLPGVVAVGTSTTLPLRNDRWGTNVRLAGASNRAPHVSAGIDYVGGNYFRAMGMTLRQGRGLEERDQAADAPRVVVVTKSCANALLPGADPLGQRIHFEDADWEVVGVVEDVRYEELDTQPPPRIYAPHAFKPWNIRLVLRTDVAPLGLTSAVRQTLARVDPAHSISNVQTLSDAMEQSLGRRRGALQLVLAFAFVALALAALGVYGVMTYSFAQAQREYAIRIALGAELWKIVALTLRQGLRLTLLGIGLGLAGALLGSQVIAAQLYEVHPRDPLVLVLAPLIIAAIAFAATIVPASRAGRIDLLQVLRSS